MRLAVCDVVCDRIRHRLCMDHGGTLTMAPFDRLTSLLDSCAYAVGQWVIDNPLAAFAALCAVLFVAILYVFKAALHASDVPRRQW